MSHLKLKAKAIVAVRRRKKKEQEARDAIQASQEALEERLSSNLYQRITSEIKAPEQPPTLSQIVSEVLPLIPQQEPNTVVQMVEHPTVSKDDLHEDMEVFIKGYLPTILPEDRPAVEQIIQETTIDISEEKLEGLVSQKEFKDALRRIQDAISANQSSGTSPNLQEQINDTEEELANLIEALEDLIADLVAQGASAEEHNRTKIEQSDTLIKIAKANLMGIEIIADQEEGTLIEDVSEE